MKYPTLPAQSRSRDLVEVFRGYNHNLRISDGEFFDMKNMTSDYYPVLAPRGRRGVYASPENTQGILAKDAVCYVDGSCFVIGNTRIDMGLSTEADMCPKRLTSMGAWVIILPDKKYINTQNPEDFGDIDAVFEAVDEVTFSVCTEDGSAYGRIIQSSSPPETAPEETEDAMPAHERTVWINTSNVTSVTLNMYSRAIESWIPVTAYTRINSPGIGANFEKMDGITISGIKDDSVIGSVEFLNGTTILRERGDDFLVVDGLAWRDPVQKPGETAVRVERRMPEIDYLTEAGNRLWGCRYGIANNGEFVNEIYACKLGDFKNWNAFQGISTDSYAASCGTDGAFTGAVTLDGYPLFWKEGYLHKVYGSYPANFQIQDTACRGVQTGCFRSLAIVGERLFYKSRGGICVYDGSLPEEISDALGTERYSDAVAGSTGNKYYVSMEDAAGVWHLFVYDVEKGLWHREDNFRSDGFCTLRGELYAIEHDSRKIVAMLGSGEQAESGIGWMVQTGQMGLSMSDNKYITKLNIRMAISLGTRVRFLIQYDSMGGWEHLLSMSGSNMRSFMVPVRPRRCDHFRLRIEGSGEARIYSIAKTIEKGSDIR